MNISHLARTLRHLIYERLMTGRATTHDQAEADRIAAILCPHLLAPSLARNLLDLEHIGRVAYVQMDSHDRVADYAETERALDNMTAITPPKLPSEEGEEWENK